MYAALFICRQKTADDRRVDELSFADVGNYEFVLVDQAAEELTHSLLARDVVLACELGDRNPGPAGAGQQCPSNNSL